jgi:hypothetical protein
MMKHHTVLLQVPDYIDIDEFTDYLDGVLFGVVGRFENNHSHPTFVMQSLTDEGQSVLESNVPQFKNEEFWSQQ